MEAFERSTKLKSIPFGVSVCPSCHDAQPYNKYVEDTRKCRYRACGTVYFIVPRQNKNWMSVEEYNKKEYWKEGPFWSELSPEELLKKNQAITIRNNVLELVNSNVISQTVAAEILSISQPAVSKALMRFKRPKR